MSKPFFEKHPVCASLILLAATTVLLELVLRLANPNIFSFVYQSRRVHSYSPQWVTDLEPGRTGHLMLLGGDGRYLLNFIITTNQYGFRTYDREIDNNYSRLAAGPAAPAPPVKIIHAVGDSFTMGWGIDFSSSYPAILDWMLPEDYRVLNLGVDGYGTIAATEKSMSLWDRFPASHVVYVCHCNDFTDDDRVVKNRRRPPLYHSCRQALDILRKNTYVANIPFAIKWYLYFASARSDRRVVSGKRITLHNIDTSRLLTPAGPVTVTAGRSDPGPSIRGLKAYRDFLKKNNAGLTVFILGSSGNRDVQRMYSFCKQQSITVLVLDFPDSMRLIRDGHLNRLGNAALARIAYRTIFDGAAPD